MPTLPFARALMGTSLAFHIIYATIGVGLPFLLMVAEGLALFRKDEVYHQIARRWIRSASVLFAIGAVSGTILSFELGFLWPRFMGFAGGLIGLPFAMEGFAFFTEAIFLGLYLYGSKRLTRRGLFLVTIPITIASAASAVFVIAANSWMNTPAGFQLSNGAITDVQPFQALNNPAWYHEALHGTLAAFAATSVAVTGIYAWSLRKGRDHEYNRKALTLAMATAAVAVPLMLVSGDYSARSVANTELPKFAAMEGIFQTTQGAPLHIGGWPDPATQTVRFGIAIPKLLSWLGYRDPNATVRGLDSFPAGTTPDPRPVHVFFDLMVGSFFIMMLGILIFWWIRWRTHQVPTGKWALLAIAFASPFGFIALESGWMVTEFGRQPWVAVNFMKTAQGVTPRTEIAAVFLVFVAVYIALTIGLLWLLLRPTRAETGNQAPPGGRYAHS